MTRAVRNSDLCALIDGECQASERRRIQAEVLASRQLTERVAAWRKNDASLRFALTCAPDIGWRECVAPPVTMRQSDTTVDNMPPIKDSEERPSGTGQKAAALTAFAGGCVAAALAFLVFAFG